MKHHIQIDLLCRVLNIVRLDTRLSWLHNIWSTPKHWPSHRGIAHSLRCQWLGSPTASSFTERADPLSISRSTPQSATYRNIHITRDTRFNNESIFIQEFTIQGKIEAIARNPHTLRGAHVLEVLWYIQGPEKHRKETCSFHPGAGNSFLVSQSAQVARAGCGTPPGTSTRPDA